jgi:predicted phage-related endonuclease
MMLESKDITATPAAPNKSEFIEDLEYLMIKEDIRLEDERRAEVEAAIKKETAEAEARIREKYRAQGYGSDIVGDTPTGELAKSLLQGLK